MDSVCAVSKAAGWKAMEKTVRLCPCRMRVRMVRTHHPSRKLDGHGCACVRRVRACGCAQLKTACAGMMALETMAAKRACVAACTFNNKGGAHMLVGCAGMARLRMYPLYVHGAIVAAGTRVKARRHAPPRV